MRDNKKGVTRMAPCFQRERGGTDVGRGHQYPETDISGLSYQEESPGLRLHRCDGKHKDHT